MNPQSQWSRSATALAMLSAFGGSPLHMLGMLPSRKQPEQRPCLQCGKPKRHNNAFCSADCCRAHKSRGK